MVYIRYWKRNGLASGQWEVEAIDSPIERVKEMIVTGNYIDHDEFIGSEARIITYDEVKEYSREEAEKIFSQTKYRFHRPGKNSTIIEVNFKDLERKLMSLIAENKDPHTETAKLLFGVSDPTEEQRRLAKTINFGVLYE